ncbi:MAG: DUF559 domain-containing protein [Actinomycetota bacterium]
MHSRQLDQLMRILAEEQHGLLARRQLRARGVSRQAVGYRLRSPDWESFTDRVLRLVGMPATGEQHAMGAVLDAGADAVVSHGSAAALWGLPGFRVRPTHLSVARKGRDRRTALAVVHRPMLLPDHHLTARAGIPVTTLARTVVDLAETEHRARVDLALNAAVRLGMTWDAVAAVVDEVGTRGRSGTSLVRSLLAEHRGERPLGSGLEGRFLSIITGAGLPAPRRQVDLGAGDWVGRVDFLYDDVGLVIEVDGAWHHEGVLGVRRDKRRAAALAAAGFRVLPVSEDLIRSSPGEVIRLVREARRPPAQPTAPHNDMVSVSHCGRER